MPGAMRGFGPREVWSGWGWGRRPARIFNRGRAPGTEEGLREASVRRRGQGSPEGKGRQIRKRSAWESAPKKGEDLREGPVGGAQKGVYRRGGGAEPEKMDGGRGVH